MNKKNKENILDEKGQALFEAMVFIPILLYLMMMMVTIGNSISTAINQNQSTRTYLFYIMRGNSDALGTTDIEPLQAVVADIGSFMIGWREQVKGARGSIGTKFKIPSLPWAESSEEDCSNAGLPTDTSCIKVFTMFGVCGETLAESSTGLFRGSDPSVGRPTSSCEFK